MIDVKQTITQLMLTVDKFVHEGRPLMKQRQRQKWSGIPQIYKRD